MTNAQSIADAGSSNNGRNAGRFALLVNSFVKQISSGVGEQALAVSLATLSRTPTADELQVARQHVQRSDDRASGLRDLQRALINSNEFLLRH